MPTLHLIGDSISIAYGPHLALALPSGWSYSRMGDEALARRDLDQAVGANGGDSARVLAHLETRPDGPIWDLLLLNCGLHDLKRLPPDDRFQVAPDAYRRNLAGIIAQAQRLTRRLVWVSTTAVDDALHAARGCGFARRDDDVISYNTIADAVMAAHQVPTIDLGGFTRSLGHGPDTFSDGVHFHDHIAQQQAAHLVGALGPHLESLT